ncbi:MAG: Ig-like domain-containing protein [Gemmatimonadetes bacterium]|nr:Ig-like domain-containing protein [Gemmatimonadota bacterium]
MFARAGNVAVVVCSVSFVAACSGDEHLGPVPIQKSTVRITPSVIDLDALADLGQFTATRTDGQGRPSNLNRFLWRSLSPNIAQIDGAGRVVSLSQGTAVIEVSVNGERATAEVVVEQVPVMFSLGSGENTLETINQEMDIKIVARDKNGFRIPREWFDWESDDTGVVQVSDLGRIRAVQEGETLVRARKKGQEDSTRVTVRRTPNAVIVSPARDTLVSIDATLDMRAYQTDESGNSIAESGFEWSSSNSSVVTVTRETRGGDEYGVVRARGAGTAEVRATLGSHTGVAEITVRPTVETVDVSPSVATIAQPGQTVQLTASGTDAGGQPVSGTPFSWSSSQPGVATVDGSGRVEARSSGWTQVTAMSPSGAKGFATVTVGEIALNVRPEADTLDVGEETSLAVYPTDANGATPHCPSADWNSLNESVASVNSTGRVVAKAIGAAAIVVAACGTTDTASIVVTDPAGGGGDDGGGGNVPPPSTVTVPELPRSLPTLPSGGWSNTIRVDAGGDLQAAIDAATAGTQILLEKGATFTGQFTLRNRGDDGWVRIATDIGASASSRVDTTLDFAKIVGDLGNGTIMIGDGADGWALSLLEVTSSLHKANGPIMMKGGDDVADRILVDRVYVHPKAGGTNHLHRCIQANASNVTIRYSVLADCHQPSTQTQGIVFWNTPGPIHIHDNLIMGASQGVMSGGAGGVRNHPSDITIRRNHFLTPASWQGVYHNLAPIEWKDVRRVLIEGNVIEGGEFAFLFKSSAQSGVCGNDCGSTDITVRRNRIFDTKHGVNLLRQSAGATVPLSNILFEDNVYSNIGPDSQGWQNGDGRMHQLLSAPHNLIIRNTTLNTSAHTYLYMSGTHGQGAISPKGNRLVYENVVAPGPFQYRFLVQTPAGIDNHYESYKIGPVYGDCERPPAGATVECHASAPGGAGANLSLVNSATNGVVR